MLTDPESRSLLLHSDLESFLISTLKKSEQGRSFARQLFSIFLLDSLEAQRLDSPSWLKMTDSQIAAVVWHLQLEHFFDSLKLHNSSQVRSLHCDLFLDDPENILNRIINFFDLDMLAGNFDRLMDQAPLTNNSKTLDQSYDATRRESEYDQARANFEGVLKVILPWAHSLEFRYKYSDRITHKLM